MTALYIILGILAFFFILFSIPVHVVASVNTEVKLWIRFLFVKIPIFPRKKKPKKQGKQTSEPKPKKEKTKGGTKETDKLVRRLEREIEKQEQFVADLDLKIEDAAADYQELTRLLGEKEEAEAVLMDLMEQWEKAQE